MSESRQCICPEYADAQSCYEIRYFGYTPAFENSSDETGYPPEVCECACGHDEDDEGLVAG